MKQKHKTIVLVALVLVAVLVWSFEWRRQAPALQIAGFIQDATPLGEENLQIRFPELLRAQATEYKSTGRNPFRVGPPPSPKNPNMPKPPVVPSGPTTPVQPTEPTTVVVPTNLKYFGYGTVPNGTPRLAFVSDGEAVYIVSEGGILLGRYRVLRVGNASLEFQEISSGRPGAMPLDEQVAPPAA